MKNQLLTVFDNPYLATLNNEYNGYATRSMIYLIAHPYEQYVRISSIYMAANEERLCTPYNAEEPLKSLVKRLN